MRNSVRRSRLTVAAEARVAAGSARRGISWGRRARQSAAVLGCAAAAAAGLHPGLAVDASADTGMAAAQRTVVVHATAGALDGVVAEARGLGGHVESEMAALDMAVVTLRATAVPALAAAPGVAELTPDGTVQLQDDQWSGGGDGTDAAQGAGAPSSSGPQTVPAGQPGAPVVTAAATGVSGLWRAGLTGAGVDVALIDSGVAPVAGLDASSQLVYGPDLSFDSQSARLRLADAYGHGTHMAGIIAGHDPGVDVISGALPPSAYTGVAPGARIVSVKVADATGATDVTQVLAGIDWAVSHAHRGGLNIRVINLSFGTTSTQSYLIDPLAHAVEAAWRQGIVVVVAAGNSGSSRTGLEDPALDPFVIAVGALDTSGSGVYAQHAAAAFSARGDGTRNPDLLAPGTHIVSLRDPGSYVDQRYGSTGRLGSRYFLGSGTSQAAAYVSGTAALLLQGRPGLSPDQLKGVLTGTAAPLARASRAAAGHGVLSVAGALAAPAGSRQAYRFSSGGGSIDAARGGRRLTRDGVTLDGERDVFGRPLDSSALAALEDRARSWSGGAWDGTSWSGSGWTQYSWSGTSWSVLAWRGTTWSGTSWSGTSWSDTSWQGTSWSGAGWTGTSWSGTSWSGCDWTGTSWSAHGWR